MNQSNIPRVCNLLFVNTHATLGGAELTQLDLMATLDRSRYKAHLVTGAEGKFSSRARALGVEVCINPLPGLSRRRPQPFLSGILDLVKHIRRHKIDLVETSGYSVPMRMQYVSFLTGVPYLAHVTDFNSCWFMPPLLPALKRARLVVVNSRATEQVCADSGIRRDKMAIVYPGIDINLYEAATQADRLRLRLELGIPQTALVVGIVGQVQPIKGHTDFITATLSMAATEPNLRFLIVGQANCEADQRFAEEINARIESSHYKNLFHVTGFRSDIPAVMKSIDILAVPSYKEPFGRVVIEGMAAGCAVIGTRAGGIPEIITHDDDGLLVPPRDAIALRDAILRLIRDAELRTNLSKRGLASARRFGTTRLVQSMQGVYSTVLGLTPTN